MALGAPEMALHNRLTHSLKVEQVGQSLFTKLVVDYPSLANDADPDAIAAACLAHDIGHPPFGHAGEQELDSLVVCAKHRKEPRSYAARVDDPCSNCALEDGFEGNAQSFRVISVLAIHRDSEESPTGLDLTRASLQATSKYPWVRGAEGRKRSKWGAYDCDKKILEWSSGSDSSDSHLSAQVMDWADDISYAVHDLEDFFRIGVIPIDDYRPNSQTLDQFLKYVQSPGALGVLSRAVLDALDNLLTYFPTARFSGRTTDMAILDRLRGRLLTQFISPTEIVDGQVKREEVQERLNEILKQFIWYHVIDEPHLSNIQAGQRRVLRDIFDALLPVAQKAFGSGEKEPNAQELRRLPFALNRAIGLGIEQDSRYTLSQKIHRGLLDYISGLSDSEAYALHAVLKGREVAGRI